MTDDTDPPLAPSKPELGTPGNPIPPGTLKGALKTFRKRIAIMRLDKESGKIGGPLSSGKSSGITAITPPSQFPREVWEELVKQGKLSYEGHGLYKLIEP